MSVAGSRKRPRIAWGLLLAAAAGAAVIGAERVQSLRACWRWQITDGREGPNIYAIWRLLHGYPLYAAPNEPPYTLTLYNFGFYHFYAAVMRLFGADGERLLAWPRVVTATGAVVGAVLFARLAKRLAPPEGRFEQAALVGFAFVTWFGTQFFSWWPFDIRPDIWSLAIALVGLDLVLTGLERAAPRILVLASLVFWVAWSFKQATVWTFAASMLAALVFTRRAKLVASLAIPFVVLSGLTLAIGGPAYRVSLLVAPALSVWDPSLLVEVFSRSIAQNLWIFCFGFCELAVILATRRQVRTELPLAERTLLVVGAVALLFGGLSTGREGANKNYLFEAYIACGLASWAALHRAAEPRPGGALLRAAAVALLLPWAVFPLLQLARPNRFGRTVLCTESDTSELRSLAAVVAELPKPLYADHDVFSQPWQATHDAYPALVLDSTWVAIAKRAHFMANDFLDRLFADGTFKSGLFFQEDPIIGRLVARGASCRVLEQRPFLLTHVVCLPPPVGATKPAAAAP